MFAFRKNVLRAGIAQAGIGLLILSLPVSAQAGADKSKDVHINIGVGIDVTHEVNESNLGLPVYPGARLHKDDAKDDSSADVKISAGMFGLKVVVVKLESDDPPGTIEAFYRHALAKYGDVLTCTAASHADGKDGSGKLSCDDNPAPGELVLKAGREKNQHIVAIKPNGHGRIIELVFVQVAGLGD